MMKKTISALMLICCLGMAMMAGGCERQSASDVSGSSSASAFTPVSRTTKVQDVIGDPVFGGYGRLIFPVERSYDPDLALEDVGDILTWYTHVRQDGRDRQ